MTHLTIRNVPEDLAIAIRNEKERRAISLNLVVLDLLRQSLGVGFGGKRSNGLAKLAGTWSAAEHEEFQAAIASTEQIDREMWH